MQLLVQNDRVEGYVIDSDGKGIQNAVVSFEHPGFHSRNDANGRGTYTNLFDALSGITGMLLQSHLMYHDPGSGHDRRVL